MAVHTTNLLSSAVFICTLYWLIVLVTGLRTFCPVVAGLGFAISCFFEAVGLMAGRPVARGAGLGGTQTRGAPAWEMEPGTFWSIRLWETDFWTGFSVAFRGTSETDFGLDKLTLGLEDAGREVTDLDRTLGKSGFGITFFSVVFASPLGFLKQSILDCTTRPLYVPGLDFWMAETVEGGFCTSSTSFLCLTVCCVRKAWLSVLRLVGSASLVLVFGLTSFSLSVFPELSSLRSFFDWRGADLFITLCFDTILQTCFFGPQTGLLFSLLF